MKLRLPSFIASFLVFFLIMEVMRELLLSRKSMEEFMDNTLKFVELSILSAILFLLYALVAYLVLFYCYKKFAKGLTATLVLLGALSVIGLRYVLEEIVLKAITGFGNYYGGITVSYYIFDNLYYAILYTAFGVCWFFVTYSVYKEQQQQALQLENKKSELSFLRAQVNPHFLFNMLNNIYALINMGSDKALMATDKLSQLLRYSLYEANQQVTVERELQSVNDYVELQGLRFRESVQITTTVSPNIDTLPIMPFVLLPLIENAFKHGVATDALQPIILDLKHDGSTLQITVANAIATREKDETGGIGIGNLKKRLELTYGKNHNFKVHNDGKRHTVIINLNIA
jgi:hypothetical protein